MAKFKKISTDNDLKKFAEMVASHVGGQFVESGNWESFVAAQISGNWNIAQDNKNVDTSCEINLVQ